MSLSPIRLKHPIVLVHGLGAKSFGPFDYFYGLPKLLREAGNQVIIPQLAAWHTIEYRANQLKQQMIEKLPEGKFNLIGHSLGGLDARYLTSCLGLAERVASVTTIGTPNRGSILSDLASGLSRGTMTGAAWGAISSIDRMTSVLGISFGALKQVSCRNFEESLNIQMPDMQGVGYFSATSAIADPCRNNALPLFWGTHGILKKHEGDNDGYVSVTSAQWGHHICTYSGDHYAQIGHLLGRTRGMDYLRFYGEIFSYLKKQGY